MISLVEVEEKNITHKKILFDFLKKKRHNISHDIDIDIDFEHHSEFVSKHPYRKWFLIKDQIRFITSKVFGFISMKYGLDVIIIE